VGGNAATGASAKRYAPPYKIGPSGGDSFNVVRNDPATGRIAVVRAYPVPAVLFCGGASAYQQQRVKHKVTSAVHKVTLAYDQAATDGYTFLSLLVRDDKGRFLGSSRVRGPLVGAGSISASIKGKAPKRGRTLVIDFGLSVSSACPSADGGTVQLPSVTVS
jgi:hypothetical protein